MSPAVGKNGQERPKAEGFPLAPLIESLIDVQFENSFAEQELSLAKDALSDVYAEIIETPHHAVNLDLETGATDIRTETRYRLVGADTTEVMLLRHEGIATSQLAPYKDWEHLYSRFARDFQLINGSFGPRKLKRVAVRSLNRIDVPPTGEIVQYEDYIALQPTLPDGLDPINSFRLQITVSIPELLAVANIAVGGLPPALEDKASFLLDIDLYRDVNIPDDARELEALFVEFRRVKNDLYKKCLTEKALKEFG